MNVAEFPNSSARILLQRVAWYTQKADESVANRRRICFPKKSENVLGKLRIIDQPPLLYYPLVDDGEKNVLSGFCRYYQTLSIDKQFLLDRYRIVDYAVKVVGVGSVGTKISVRPVW